MLKVKVCYNTYYRSFRVLCGLWYVLQVTKDKTLSIILLDALHSQDPRPCDSQTSLV
jgi:hypothetical protein